MPVDIQTILVATDLSAASVPATAYAFFLARALHAHLYILSVVPEDDVRLITAIRAHLQSDVTPEALVETFYTEADKRLATLVEDARATDLVHERLIVTGEPATAIMSWAAAKQVQLIILGTHGRRGVTRFMMGSVAERVLREAACAVLVIPATTESMGTSPAAATRARALCQQDSMCCTSTAIRGTEMHRERSGAPQESGCSHGPWARETRGEL